MSAQPLPHELTALIHHVELNKAGWHQKALELIVLSTVQVADAPVPIDSLSGLLREKTGARLPQDILAFAARRLLSRGEFVEPMPGLLRVSQARSTELSILAKEAAELELRVEIRFEETLKKHDLKPEGDLSWASFNRDFLTPLVRELGARAYELLTQDAPQWAHFGAFRSYKPATTQGQAPQVRRALSEILDARNPDIRSWVLRQLHSYFLLEASALSEKTVTALEGRMREPPHFQVLVDTNFLFSILGLHENPSNDAAQALFDLLQDLKGRVDIKFCVLRITLDEATRALIGHRNYLEDLWLTPNLGRAARVRISDLTGLSQRYVEAANASSGRLRAEDYFGPYISNILAMSRAKGVDLFNESTDSLKMDKDVLDDVAQCMEFEEEKKKKRRRSKSYEAWEHDIILWHFVSRKRSKWVESVLDALYWVITIDYRLMGFDLAKVKRDKERLPLCVDPTGLMHLLQFWIPRSARLEEAMVSSLRPLLPQVFDPDAERVTLRILAALSRFEKAGDLSEETVTGVLTNQALRQRINPQGPLEKDVELIRDALIAGAEDWRRDIEKERKEKESLLEEKRSREARVAELSESLGQSKDQVRIVGKRMAGKLVEEREKSRTLERRVGSLEKSLEEMVSREKQRGDQVVADAQASQTASMRTRFAATWSAVSVLGAAVVWSAVSFGAKSGILVSAGSAVATLIAGLLLCEKVGRGAAEISQWPPFMKLQRARRKLIGTLTTIALGVIGNAVWDWIKRSSS